MEQKTVSMLIVEDDPDYVFLLKDLLVGVEATEMRYHRDYAGTIARAGEALAHGIFDVVLLDLSLPDSQGLETVKRIVSAAPGIPVIVLTSLDDEAMGVQAIQEGAQDYLIKGEISFRVLRRAINYAIERMNLLLQVEKNTREIKVLRGLLPICCYCKKIRDDSGYWQQMESYIRDNSEAEFTHGMCPKCAEKAMKDLEIFCQNEEKAAGGLQGDT